MGVHYGYRPTGNSPYTPIILNGLSLHLDAANTASYSGTGTSWNDLSGNNYNFTLTSSAAYVGTGVKYMDFNANRATIASGTDMPVTGNITAIVWTRIKNSTSDWRTLFRAQTTGGNHQVIVESGSYRLGMYSGSYRDSGFLQSSIPGYNTGQWNMLVWRFSTVSPYYTFSYNDTPGIIRGSSTDSSTQFNQGIYSLGAYQGNSQYWGDIAQLLFYNRILTDDEILQTWNSTRSRFGV